MLIVVAVECFIERSEIYRKPQEDGYKSYHFTKYWNNSGM